MSRVSQKLSHTHTDIQNMSRKRDLPTCSFFVSVDWTSADLHSALAFLASFAILAVAVETIHQAVGWSLKYNTICFKIIKYNEYIYFLILISIVCSNKEPNGTSPNNHQTHPPDMASKWSTPSEDSKALVQIYQNITKLCLCSTSSFCFSSNPSPQKIGPPAVKTLGVSSHWPTRKINKDKDKNQDKNC